MFGRKNDNLIVCNLNYMVNIKEIIIVCWYAVLNDGEKLSKDSTCNHDAGIQILYNEYAVR